VRGEGATRRIAVRQPAPPLGRQLNDRERLAVLDALALSTGDIDTRCPLRIVGGAGTRLLIGVRSTEQLKQLKPDFSRLTTLSAQLGAAGFFVFTLSHAMTGCLTESRMFCPALGIPEDPVSGNAHGLLGAYLAEQGLLPHTGATARFTGAQGHHVHRAGRVDVELEFSAGKLDGVWIVGQASDSLQHPGGGLLSLAGIELGGGQSRVEIRNGQSPGEGSPIGVGSFGILSLELENRSQPEVGARILWIGLERHEKCVVGVLELTLVTQNVTQLGPGLG